MKIRQCMMSSCPYVVVYYKGTQKAVKRFSASAIAKKGFGYGEMACAEFLAANPQYIDGIKLDINRTHYSDDAEFTWLYVSEL